MASVRTKWKHLRWALAGLPLLLGAGCSGINTTQSISPLDFLMPGAGRLFHMQYTPEKPLLDSGPCFAALDPSLYPPGIPE
jgi:hypothetical protein